MTRRRLPNRRAAELYDLTFKGLRYTIGVSRFPGGALAEAFVHSSKASCDLADAARDAAVTLSLALQYGTPADAIRAAVTREADGSPAGIVGAVLDLILEADLNQFDRTRSTEERRCKTTSL